MSTRINSFVVVSSYNNDTSWIPEYTDDFIVYEKGEPREGTVPEKNVGYNIYTYFKYIVDHYDILPEVVMFIKGNVFPRHMTKEEFDEKCGRTDFTPLLSMKHVVYEPICRYENGMYLELNNYWYVSQYEAQDRSRFDELKELLRVKDEQYLRFAPGACYIVPRKNIIKHPKDYYAKLLTFIDRTQLPAEAHLLERSLYKLWY